MLHLCFLPSRFRSHAEQELPDTAVSAPLFTWCARKALSVECRAFRPSLSLTYNAPKMSSKQPTNQLVQMSLFSPWEQPWFGRWGAVGVVTLLVSPALQQLGLRQPLKPVFSFSLLGSAQTGPEWKAGFPAQTGLSGSVLHGPCRGSTKRCFISVFSVKNPVPLTYPHPTQVPT